MSAAPTLADTCGGLVSDLDRIRIALAAGNAEWAQRIAASGIRRYRLESHQRAAKAAEGLAVSQIVTIEELRQDNPLGMALLLGYGPVTARAMAREVRDAQKRGESRDHAIKRVIKPKDALHFDVPKVRA